MNTQANVYTIPSHKETIDKRFKGHPVRKALFKIAWPFKKARINWQCRSIRWQRVPSFVYFMLAKSEVIIGWAIIRYRETEDDNWRQFAIYLIEYAFLGNGTNWHKSDLTL